MDDDELAERAEVESAIADMERAARKLDAIKPHPFRDVCFVMLPGDRRLACCNARAAEQQLMDMERNDMVIDKQQRYLAKLETMVSGAEAQQRFGRKPSASN
jgi:hypothetical protein